MTNYYLTTNPTTPVPETIPRVTLNPVASTFTVDYPALWNDPGIAWNQTTSFYLVAEVGPVVQFKTLQFNLQKRALICWTTLIDTITRHGPE